VWLPLIIAAVVIVLAAFIVLWSLVASLWAVVISFAAGGLAAVATAPFLGGLSGTLVHLGAGLVLIGLSLLLYQPATYEVADVIGTYVYREGIVGGAFSYTAAVGLFMAVFGFILTFTANRVSNKLTDYGLW
jgi:hypothetical protein